MAKLSLLKRYEFTPMAGMISLVRADVYSNGRRCFVFLTLTNPEKRWHREGIAHITPFDDERESLGKIGVKLDLSLVGPGETFTYPDEIPFPPEFEGFNFEFVTIDGVKAPAYQANESIDVTDEESLAPAPAPAPTKVKEKKEKPRKSVEVIRFASKRTPVWLFAALIVASLGVGATLFGLSRFPTFDPVVPGTQPGDYATAGLMCRAINDTESAIVGMDNAKGGVKIPAKDEQGRTIRAVYRGAFWNNQDLVSITAEGAIDFQSGAISGCRSLREMNLPEYSVVRANAISSVDPSAFTLNLGSYSDLDLQTFSSGSVSVVYSGSAGKVNRVSASDPFSFEGKTSRDSQLAFNNSAITSLKLRMHNGTLPDELCADCPGLSTVTLSSSSTSSFKLGRGCFANCTSLRSVPVASDVTSIGERCFRGCTRLPSSLNLPRCKTVGALAFYDTNVREVTLPEGASVNRENSFPAGTTVHIGSETFVVGEPEVKPFAFQYESYNDGVMITGYEGVASGNVVNIPVMYGSRPVRAIGAGAFSGLTVSGVYGGDNLQEIQAFAFEKSTVETISLASGNLYTHQYALYDAYSLSRFAVSGRLSIGGILRESGHLDIACGYLENTVEGCFGMGTASIDTHLESKEQWLALDRAGVTHVVIRDYVGEDLFDVEYKNQDLVEMDIRVPTSGPGYRVGSKQFASVGAKLVHFNWDGVTEIGEESFANSGFESIEFGARCTYIGNRAFQGSALSYVSFKGSTVYEDDSFPSGCRIYE